MLALLILFTIASISSKETESTVGFSLFSSSGATSDLCGLFVPTHLRSRFIAESDEPFKYKEQLLLSSRFYEVESKIIEEIKGRGTFLRIKSFVDGASVPMLDFMDVLLDFSAQNSTSGRVLIDKRRQVQKWSQSFKDDSIDRINTLISKVMDELRMDVSDFAEENYENKNAGENWDKHIKTAGIKEKVNKLQNKLVDECNKALSEIARELQNELSFIADLTGDRSIKMEAIFDSKRWWNWGIKGIAGGLGIAAIVIGSGPLGIAAGAVGLVGSVISFFIDDREKKVRQGRERLSKKLHVNINSMEKNLRKQLVDWFHKDLYDKRVNILLNDIGMVTSSVFNLADTQRNLAWTINNVQNELNRTVIKEALESINAAEMDYHIIDIARIPGLATMFLINPQTRFPEEIRKGLEYLLGEKVWFVINTGNQKSLLSQAIGRECDRSKLSIDEKLKVAYVEMKGFSASAYTRIKLAQQLTSLHILQKKGVI
jgi:hypothetical protein